MNDVWKNGSEKKKKVIVIGGGAAGMSAAWTLQKQGIETVLLEANSCVGGRLGGDRVDGFLIDEGADFFCHSYDVTFQVCKELELPLIRSEMNLGWFRGGKWSRTTPLKSFGDVFRNLPSFWKLGLLSPGFIKLAMDAKRNPEYHNFSSTCRISEIDEGEKFGDYLARRGVSETLQVTLGGFLEMTMGHIERSASAYMLAYVAEMLLNSDHIYAPEKGAGELTHALAKVCGDCIHVSTPVRNVTIEDGQVTCVVVDSGPIAADAVICAVTATKVAGIIPDLPEVIHQELSKVNYSQGCRVVIGLDQRPLPPGWHGALYPEDETPLLLDRSINLPGCVPPGKCTLDMLVGRERAAQLFPLDDQEIEREMLQAAMRNPPPGSALPNPGEGLFSRVYRWDEAVCMGPPGMFKAMANLPAKLSQEVSNLFLAGDYMEIPSINGALVSGINSANEVIKMLESRSS